MGTVASSENVPGSTQSVKLALSGILVLIIVEIIFLCFAIIQTDVAFLGEGTWRNEAGCFSQARVYTLAILTTLISFNTTCYGFWRDCISDTMRKNLDKAFSIGASSSGVMFLACFVLFFDFRQEPGGQNFADGNTAKLIFGVCCFLLAVLFFGLLVNVRGSVSGDKSKKKKNHKTSVDSSPLI